MKECWIVASVTHLKEGPIIRIGEQMIIDGIESFNSEKDARAAIALAGRVGEFVPVYIPNPGHYIVIFED